MYEHMLVVRCSVSRGHW